MTYHKTAQQIINRQIQLAIIISFLLGITRNVDSGISFFFGSLIHIIPTIAFMKMLFKNKHSPAKKIMNNAYKGETLKLILTMLIFVLALKWQRLNILILFLGLMVMQIAHWVIPLLATIHKPKLKTMVLKV